MLFSQEEADDVRRFIELDTRKRELNAELNDMKIEMGALGVRLLVLIERAQTSGLSYGGLTVGKKDSKTLDVRVEDNAAKERLATFDRYDCMTLSHSRLKSLLTTKKGSNEALHPDLAQLFDVIVTDAPTVRRPKQSDLLVRVEGECNAEERK